MTGHPAKKQNIGLRANPWLLDTEIRLALSYTVKKWHGGKGWGELKINILKTVYSFF